MRVLNITRMRDYNTAHLDFGTRTLKYLSSGTMSGTDVRNVQTRLAYIGFDPARLTAFTTSRRKPLLSSSRSIGGRTSAVLPMMVLLATTRRKLFAIR